MLNKYLWKGRRRKVYEGGERWREGERGREGERRGRVQISQER